MQTIENRLSERDQLGPGPDRAPDIAWPAAVRAGIGRFARADGRGAVDLHRPLGESIFRKRARSRAEGVGLDRIRAGIEIGGVDGGNQIGAREVEVLVAAVVPAPVGFAQGGPLHLRAECPVHDEHISSQPSRQTVLRLFFKCTLLIHSRSSQDPKEHAGSSPAIDANRAFSNIRA